MASLKSKEIKKMTKAERDKKIKELKLELLKSKTPSQKTGGAKIKEIKKIIARILTINNSDKKEALKKK